MGLGLGDAGYAFNDTSKWWERLLRVGPAASLSKELGVHHNISWNTFLHYTCLVRLASPLLRLIAGKRMLPFPIPDWMGN